MPSFIQSLPEGQLTKEQQQMVTSYLTLQALSKTFSEIYGKSYWDSPEWVRKLMEEAHVEVLKQYESDHGKEFGDAIYRRTLLNGLYAKPPQMAPQKHAPAKREIAPPGWNNPAYRRTLT